MCATDSMDMQFQMLYKEIKMGSIYLAPFCKISRVINHVVRVLQVHILFSCCSIQVGRGFSPGTVPGIA